MAGFVLPPGDCDLGRGPLFCVFRLHDPLAVR
jgi:hypothetical protein